MLTAEEFDRECAAVGDWFVAQLKALKSELEVKMKAAMEQAEGVPPHLAFASIAKLMQRISQIDAEIDFEIGT